MSEPKRPRPDNFEPAPRDPGAGWLRSRFLGLPWPRLGHEAACGRPSCPVCAAQAAEKFECAPMPSLDAPTVRERAGSRTGELTDGGNIQTEDAIKQLRHYFHVYEGWGYITLRCGICEQMFGIQPNVPIMERGSFDMLMSHAKAHGKMPAGPLDYSPRYSERKAALGGGEGGNRETRTSDNGVSVEKFDRAEEDGAAEETVATTTRL